MRDVAAGISRLQMAAPDGPLRADSVVDVIQILGREEQRLLVEDWPEQVRPMQVAWAAHVIRVGSLCRRVLDVTSDRSVVGHPPLTVLAPLAGREREATEAASDAVRALQELVAAAQAAQGVPEDLFGPPRRH
jgi:hypothetical protein